MPQKFSQKFWEKISKTQKKSKVISCLFLDQRGLYFSNFFFKPWNKIPRLFSGHKWCKLGKKKLEKSSAYVYGTCVVLHSKVLEKHSSPPPPHPNVFFLQKPFFSVKNVELRDRFIPFCNQPSVALEAGKIMIRSIRQQLFLRYVL